jgi:hypothetical protein
MMGVLGNCDAVRDLRTFRIAILAGLGAGARGDGQIEAKGGSGEGRRFQGGWMDLVERDAVVDCREA